jgi:hypothetical protein
LPSVIFKWGKYTKDLTIRYRRFHSGAGQPVQPVALAHPAVAFLFFIQAQLVLGHQRRYDLSDEFIGCRQPDVGFIKKSKCGGRGIWWQ